MLTFKEFLLENAATPGNVDASFTVGGVQFDNERGMGATPNNANVAYMGAVVWMKPSVFRKLAHSADRVADAKKFAELLRSGTAMACPFLDISMQVSDDDKPISVKVRGHEGRARADAFRAINGDVLMPVHLFFRGGTRARDLTPELFQWISQNGIIPENENSPIDAGIAHVFVSGKMIRG